MPKFFESALALLMPAFCDSISNVKRDSTVFDVMFDLKHEKYFHLAVSVEVDSLFGKALHSLLLMDPTRPDQFHDLLHLEQSRQSNQKKVKSERFFLIYIFGHFFKRI